eukprot:297618_1
MAFPIRIQDMHLSVEGVRFESWHRSLVIEPFAFCKSVKLSGKPVESGKLSFKGCIIRSFNIAALHPINSLGRGIAPIPESTLARTLTPAPVCPELSSPSVASTQSHRYSRSMGDVQGLSESLKTTTSTSHPTISSVKYSTFSTSNSTHVS